jgi:hypothetical protein
MPSLTLGGCVDFAQIIEAGLEDLSIYLESQDLFSSIENFYGHFILAYQRGNVGALSRYAQEASEHFYDHAEKEDLETALNLRIGLRNREVSEDLMARGLDLARKADRWKGELLILVGTALTLQDKHKEAQELFLEAIPAFEKIGAHKKALKSRLNILVADSHLDKKANLIENYFSLYRRALKPKSRDDATASICLLNISREYQLLGTMHAALKYCTEAIDIAEANFGSQHYFLCLAHRSHLFYEMNRFTEARVDYECAVASTFPEVLAALKVLKPKLQKQFPDLESDMLPVTGKPEHLLPTWKSRIGEQQEISLSPLENKLVGFLGSGAKEKIDILEYLYGEKLDYEVKLNRFKNLLGNLRRKSPDLIICEQGHYRLSTQIQSPKRKKR